VEAMEMLVVPFALDRVKAFVSQFVTYEINM
jgi:hypothetical protein